MKEWLRGALGAPFPGAEAPSGTAREGSRGGRSAPSSSSRPPPLRPPPQPRFERSQPQICSATMKRQKPSWRKVGDVESRSRPSRGTAGALRQRASPSTPSRQNAPHQPHPSPPRPPVGLGGREGGQLVPSLQHILSPTLPCLFYFLFCHLKHRAAVSPDCWCCSAGFPLPSSPPVPGAMLSPASKPPPGQNADVGVHGGTLTPR